MKISNFVSWAAQGPLKPTFYEVSQRKRNTVWHLLHVESEKTNDTNELTYKTKRDSQTWRTNLQRPGEGVYTDCGINMDTLLYLKWITNKDLCRAHGTLLNSYVAAWMGGGFGGERIHVYVWLSPFTVHLKLSQHCLSAISQYKLKSSKKPTL